MTEIDMSVYLLLHLYDNYVLHSDLFFSLSIPFITACIYLHED